MNTLPKLMMTCSLSIMCLCQVLSQTLLSDQEKKDTYPMVYTFEKAKEYEDQSDFKKATWFYINLFPQNKDRVIERIKVIQLKLGSKSITSFIQETFATLSVFDPDISTVENGKMRINTDKLNLKGSWGDNLIASLDGSLNSTKTAEDYYKSAFDKRKSNDLPGAITDLNKAIELKPSGELYFNRGLTKTDLDDNKGAIDDYSKAIELNYKIAEAYFEKAYNKEKIRDLKGAIEDYSSAILLDSTYANAYNNRATIEARTHDFSGALNDLNSVVKLMPNYPGGYINRGFLKYQMKDKNGACNDWQIAIKLGATEAKKYIDKYCN